MNQVILVGRLTKDPEIKELESGKKASFINLSIQRCFKNMDGIYESDYVGCLMFEHIASNISEYCHKGDVVGVKGRLQSGLEGGLQVIAEKVTFLSSQKKDDENDN